MGMRFQVLYLGTPVGQVILDRAEPAAGFLVRMPTYQVMRDLLRPSCDLIATHHYDMWNGAVRGAVAAAREVTRNLSLATDAGTAVPVASIDLWDDSIHEQAPFVLVYFRALPTGMTARIR